MNWCGVIVLAIYGLGALTGLVLGFALTPAYLVLTLACVVAFMWTVIYLRNREDNEG